MEVGAVYLQPVEMDPPGMMRAAAESDVHLEADISATEDNRNGWQEGSFVPYLSIHYTLRKKGSDEVVEGDFHPMVANDGPHYGDNVKLLGPGKYQLTYKIPPPGSGHAMFGRHTDKETGVAPLVRRLRAELRVHLRRHRQERGLLMGRAGRSLLGVLPCWPGLRARCRPRCRPTS